ncbi:unnamed protein product, partial [Linum tenue]
LGLTSRHKHTQIQSFPVLDGILSPPPADANPSSMDDQTPKNPPPTDGAAEEMDGDQSSATMVDLTSFQLHDLTSVELPPTLTELDLTANRLSSLDPRIAHLSNLTKLSLRQNLIDDAAVEPLSNWDLLSGLEVMENIEKLTNLEELWLGRNRIKQVNLCGLKCIKKISLQSNRLTSMTGFEGCVALEELYLSHNGIEKMEGLSTLVNLRVLDVSSNKLTSVDDIQNLPKLEDLWLNDNRIESLGSISDAVAGSREKLTTIYLANNPCVRFPTTIKQLKHPHCHIISFAFRFPITVFGPKFWLSSFHIACCRVIMHYICEVMLQAAVGFFLL